MSWTCLSDGEGGAWPGCWGGASTVGRISRPPEDGVFLKRRGWGSSEGRSGSFDEASGVCCSLCCPGEMGQQEE